MRVQMSDLIDPGLFYQIPEEHQSNLSISLWKANVLREASKIPMFIRNETTRKRAGYRTREMHRDLYAEISKKNGRVIKPPEYSWHLFGAAHDIADPGGRLKKWINENKEFCRVHGMYFEHFDATGGLDDGWVHQQIYPPGSMNMFFLP